jgi:hypothetical protein
VSDGGCSGVPQYPNSFGTLTIGSITQSLTTALPNGIVAIAVKNQNQIYGLHSDKTIRFLGTFPNITAGTPLANVLTPADRDAGTLAFLTNNISISGNEVLAGYTKPGAGFPGNVIIYNIADAGVRYVNAPGNNSNGPSANGFVVNGLGLGTTSGTGIYALDTVGSHLLASFAPAWMAASGFTARTANDIQLLGYFDGVDFINVIRAAPPSLTANAFQARSSFMLSQASTLLASKFLQDLTTVGNDAVIVRGDYGGAPDFLPFTIGVDKIPLTLTGSGTQTVTVGAPISVLAATDKCTRVMFAVGTATQLYVAVEDKNGRRLIQVTP